MSMRDHSSDVTWTFVVPPINSIRVLITQRQDGPFRQHATGGRGYYYVSVEDLVRGTWQHRVGSTLGGLDSFQQAEKRATDLWEAMANYASPRATTP